MADDAWTHDRMLRAIDKGEYLPVLREDPNWERNAPVLEDLLHDGLVRGLRGSLQDAAGAFTITEGFRLTDAGRQRVQGDVRTSSVSGSVGPAGFEARVLTVLIASPGDTVEARDVVEQTILELPGFCGHGVMADQAARPAA